MAEYIESLFEVVRENIYPQVTYAQIEMAVFFYMVNTMHKAESILIDQYEYFLILNESKKNENIFKEIQVLNRLKRIFGS